jgi:hypothetical protein
VNGISAGGLTRAFRLRMNTEAELVVSVKETCPESFVSRVKSQSSISSFARVQVPVPGM